MSIVLSHFSEWADSPLILYLPAVFRHTCDSDLHVLHFGLIARPLNEGSRFTLVHPPNLALILPLVLQSDRPEGQHVVLVTLLHHADLSFLHPAFVILGDRGHSCGANTGHLLAKPHPSHSEISIWKILCIHCALHRQKFTLTDTLLRGLQAHRKEVWISSYDRGRGVTCQW